MNTSSILHQTNHMAHAMFAVFGYKVPTHLKMWRSRHPTALLCWRLACGVQQQLKGADVPGILERLGEKLELPKEPGRLAADLNPKAWPAGKRHAWVLGVDRRPSGCRTDRCPCGTVRDCMPRGAARYYRAGVRVTAGSCPLGVRK